MINIFPLFWIQLALIFTPQEESPRHSGVMLFLFLFCGCLSYSNSAMNPILYAFLSENFKKSFLKACTCARGQVRVSLSFLRSSIYLFKLCIINHFYFYTLNKYRKRNVLNYIDLIQFLTYTNFLFIYCCSVRK